MRTNIDLDDKLVGEAMKLTGLTTKRAVVEEALRICVEQKKQLKKQAKILASFGKFPMDPDYDYKSMR
jgi:Arc/MetJ family transcription regulator